MKLRFFRCENCGNIIVKIEDSGVPVFCCGRAMTELVPGTSDGAAEKHVPVTEQDGNRVTVKVGSVAHPMLEDHHISFIVLETDKGFSVKKLDHTGTPEAVFMLADGETVTAAYEYCNIHGLWKK